MKNLKILFEISNLNGIKVQYYKNIFQEIHNTYKNGFINNKFIDKFIKCNNRNINFKNLKKFLENLLKENKKIRIKIRKKECDIKFDIDNNKI